MITHLVGHAVGLWHHNSREDSVQHIKLIHSNMAYGSEHNFATHALDNRGSPYDVGSIMHFISEVRKWHVKNGENESFV